MTSSMTSLDRVPPAPSRHTKSWASARFRPWNQGAGSKENATDSSGLSRDEPSSRRSSRSRFRRKAKSSSSSAPNVRNGAEAVPGLGRVVELEDFGGRATRPREDRQETREAGGQAPGARPGPLPAAASLRQVTARDAGPRVNTGVSSSRPPSYNDWSHGFVKDASVIVWFPPASMASTSNMLAGARMPRTRVLVTLSVVDGTVTWNEPTMTW